MKMGSLLLGKSLTGTMKVSQEIDALVVMGVNPVRYLMSPVLIAILVMLPVVFLYN